MTSVAGHGRTSLLPRGTPALLGVSLSYHLSFCVLIAALPVELIRQGSNTAEIGLAVGAFGIGAVLTRLAFGMFIDRLPLSMLFRAGAALLMFAVVAYALSGGLWTILVARLLHGGAFAFFGTACGLWISNRGTLGNRGTLRGIEGAVAGVCVVTGPNLGLLLAARFGLTALWILLFVTALAAMAVSLGGDERCADRPVMSAPHSVTAEIVALGLAGALMGILQAFLPLLVIWKGNVPLMLPLLAFGAALVVGRLGGGWASDRLGRRPIVNLAAVAVAAALLLLYVAHDPFAILIACAVFGGGMGGFSVVTMTIVIDRTAQRADQASVLSLSSMCWEIGIATGPLCLGLIGLLGSTSALMVMVVALGVVLAGWAIFLTSTFRGAIWTVAT